MTEQEFAARLKRYRRERGLTQQALAEILGVSNSSVSRWESGSYPDVPTLAALARVLGVTVDELINEASPVRTLTKPDWQALLSFLFALGGGLLYFLFSRFAPQPVCYLLYLAAMAYGVYLQELYTCHSRWFTLGNLVMHFFVQLHCAWVTLVPLLGRCALFLLLLGQGSVPDILAVEYLYLEHAASDRSASLLAAALSLLLAAVLTAVAALVIRWYRKRRRTGGPRLRWSPRNFQRGNLLPVLSLGLMAGYWALSGTFLLPPLFYRWQAPLFHLLTAALALLCGVMLRRRRGVLALSLGALAAGWLALSNLQIFQRAYFVRAGEVMRTTRFTANALPVGEVIPAAYLLAAILALLCLLLPLIGPEGAPRQGGGAP